MAIPFPKLRFEALAVVASLWLAPGAAAACPSGVIECNGVCCPVGVAACFDNACDTATPCSTIVCGGVCCPTGVAACFNGACDTAGVGSTCASLPCGSGCCTAEDPVCCGDDTCAPTESACGSGSSCALAAREVAPEGSATWIAIPGAVLALGATAAVRRRRQVSRRSGAGRR